MSKRRALFNIEKYGPTKSESDIRKTRKYHGQIYAEQPSSSVSATASETRSENILCSRRKSLTYAEALRQPMPDTGGYVLGRQSQTVDTRRTANDSEKFQRPSSDNLANQTDIKECEMYQQLLKQNIPRLYASDKKTGKSVSNYGLSYLSGDIEVTFRTSTTGSISSLLEEKMDFLKKAEELPMTIITLDDSLTEIIGIADDLNNFLPASEHFQYEEKILKNYVKHSDENLSQGEFLLDIYNSSYCLKTNWMESSRCKWMNKRKDRIENDMENVKTTETTLDVDDVDDIVEFLNGISLSDSHEDICLDECPNTIVEELSYTPQFVELTAEQKKYLQSTIDGPLDEVLISKFNLNITRRDIRTLVGPNWLNDEVINFYMSLLIERGERRCKTHGMPSVYAMSTFFIPRLMLSGYSGVKRWTRKVNIFEKDIIPVPVHLGGVHWCMVIIHLKDATIKYYDSMGEPNPNILNLLEQYLRDESLDKRKQPFDTSHFTLESVQNIPQQMNGSDCGVFCCMFAEYITRNKQIKFTQQNMPYFRNKMILEILQGELME